MQYRRIIEGLLVRTRLDSVLLAKEWMYSVLVSELRDGAVIPIDLKKNGSTCSTFKWSAKETPLKI